MMGIGKIIGKVAFVFVAGVAIGYTEYRLKGGEPIHKVYHDVKKARIAKTTASDGKALKTEGTVA